jgi:ABC-2 type transport system permease protein
MNLFDRKNIILLKELVKTDFKLRYQGSVVGYLWSILKPLMLFSVMYMVFIHFLRFGNGVPHFEVALLLGMVLWNFFAEITGNGLSSIVARGDLIRKLKFPNEIIIFSISISALINLAINFVIILIFALINGANVSGYFFLAPLLIIEMYLLAVGVAFILGTLFVKFRDIAPIWEVVMQAGMYATPIIYPVAMVLKVSELGAKLLLLNPIAQIIQDMRHILIDPANQTVFELWGMNPIVLIPYVIPVIIFIVGYRIFKKNSRKFAEII